MEKTYLGDGVYASIDGGDILLTTENGISVTNSIVLESSVYKALVDFGKKAFGPPEVLLIDSYRDGGSLLIRTTKGNFWVDGAINSTTKGTVYLKNGDEKTLVTNEFLIAYLKEEVEKSHYKFPRP